MEYWGSVGFEPGRCFCKHCKETNQQVDTETVHSLQRNGQCHSHRPTIVIPSQKVGFFDSYVPYGHYGNATRGSSVNTYAEATHVTSKTSIGNGSQPKVRPGVRRVSEILARLSYLESKNGLRFYDLMKSLEKDSRRERQEKTERKLEEKDVIGAMTKNSTARFPLEPPPLGHSTLDKIPMCMEYGDYFSPYQGTSTSRLPGNIGSKDRSPFQLQAPGTPTKTNTAPIALSSPSPYRLDTKTDLRSLTSGRSRKGELCPTKPLGGVSQNCYRADTYDTDSDTESSFDYNTPNQPKIFRK